MVRKSSSKALFKKIESIYQFTVVIKSCLFFPNSVFCKIQKPSMTEVLVNFCFSTFTNIFFLLPFSSYSKHRSMLFFTLVFGFLNQSIIFHRHTDLKKQSINVNSKLIFKKLNKNRRKQLLGHILQSFSS